MAFPFSLKQVTLPPADMEVHRPLQKDYFLVGKSLFALPC